MITGVHGAWNRQQARQLQLQQYARGNRSHSYVTGLDGKMGLALVRHLIPDTFRLKNLTIAPSYPLYCTDAHLEQSMLLPSQSTH